MISSPNTTITGIAMMLGAISSILVALFDGDITTVPDWPIALGAVVVGYGLLMARDNKTSSEDVPTIAAKRAPVEIK